MSDWLLEQYDEYLLWFQGWGHDFFERPLTFEQFEDLTAEREDIEIAEDCGHITNQQKRRREEIARLTLTHPSYFDEGPRVIIER